MKEIIRLIREKPKIAFAVGAFVFVALITVIIILAVTKSAVKFPGGFSFEPKAEMEKDELKCIESINEIDALIDSSIRTNLLIKQYNLMLKTRENPNDTTNQLKLNEINKIILELNVIKYSELTRSKSECLSGKLISKNLQNLKADAIKLIEK